jgi:hypothetical protein
MAVDERNRLQLAEAAKRTLGADEGITLMELLPPVGWADVATKQDLATLEARIDARFERIEAQFDARFGVVDSRFAMVDSRFAMVDSRFDVFDQKIDSLEYKFNATLHRELRSMTWKLFALVATAMSAMLGALVGLARF